MTLQSCNNGLLHIIVSLCAGTSIGHVTTCCDDLAVLASLAIVLQIYDFVYH